MAVGAAVGLVWPEFGRSLAPVGRIFLKLIQVVVAPVKQVITAVTISAASLARRARVVMA